MEIWNSRKLKETPTTWKMQSNQRFSNPVIASQMGIFFSFLQRATAPHLPTRPLPQPLAPPPSLSSPGPSATADSGVGQKPTIGAWCRPPFLQSRSTVNCVLCPAMQMCRDQSRRDGTTPMRGPPPKTNSGSLQWPGVSVVFLFFCERRRKIMTDSFFCLLAAPSAPCFSLSLRGDSLLQAVDMSIQTLISLGFLSSTLLVL